MAFEESWRGIDSSSFRATVIRLMEGNIFGYERSETVGNGDGVKLLLLGVLLDSSDRRPEPWLGGRMEGVRDGESWSGTTELGLGTSEILAARGPPRSRHAVMQHTLSLERCRLCTRGRPSANSCTHRVHPTRNTLHYWYPTY